MTLAENFELTDGVRGGLCWSVPEVATMLGISRGLAYELARSGRLPALRFGRRLLVPKAALARLLDQYHSGSVPEVK